MGQLYEEYLSSNEDWMSSSLVVNADRKLSSRRRGKYRMVMMKDLRTQYGAAVAKSLRDDKKSRSSRRARLIASSIGQSTLTSPERRTGLVTNH